VQIISHLISVLLFILFISCRIFYFLLNEFNSRIPRVVGGLTNHLKVVVIFQIHRDVPYTYSHVQENTVLVKFGFHSFQDFCPIFTFLICVTFSSSEVSKYYFGSILFPLASFSYNMKSLRTHKNFGNCIFLFYFCIIYLAKLIINPISVIAFSSIVPTEL
jgi:hypothetical protein